MRALAASFVIHALVAWWLWRPHRPAVIVEQPARTIEEAPPIEEAPIEVAMLEERAPRSAGGGGGGGDRGGGDRGGGARAGFGAPVHVDARAEMRIGIDSPQARIDVLNGNGTGNANGNGNGTGNSSGNGNGIGFGDGGGIAGRGAVPAPPEPPPPSKARPAKLLRPARDREVEDDDYLFVARVTVDTDGDVAAVRMLTTHPGVRGDQAASAIWTFHYAPALDDAGMPIRSTFEQPFQIR